MEFLFVLFVMIIRVAIIAVLAILSIALVWVLPLLIVSCVRFRSPSSFRSRVKVWLVYSCFLIAGILLWAVVAGIPYSTEAVYFQSTDAVYAFAYVASWSPLVMFATLQGFADLSGILIGLGLFALSFGLIVGGKGKPARAIAMIVACATGPIVLDLIARELTGLPERRAAELGLTCVTIKPVRAAMGQYLVRTPVPSLAAPHGVAQLDGKVVIWSYSERDWVVYQSDRGDPDAARYGAAPEPVLSC